jgi:hypothetical protein
MAGADVAAEHESRRAVRPAFEDVWTARFLADRVQVQPFDELQNVVLVRGITETDAEPFRLWLTDFLVVADYT